MLLPDNPSPEDDGPLPTLRPSPAPREVRSLSVDFGRVIDPETDWDAVSEQLADAHATTVNLGAGRVEFTAFDWSEHPDAAAEPGTDHLAVAARMLREAPDGSPRQINLIVDAFVPEWIKEDPRVAGTGVRGRRSTHGASATQLATGEVGDRLVAYVAALGERYDPAAIEVTELFFSAYTYGDEDLALYREMSAEADWPRTEDGAIDTESPLIGRWRSEVIAGLLGRMRTALDAVRDGEGRQIGLTMDVGVDWEDPASGRPKSGQDYRILLSSVRDLRLQLWAYIGIPLRPPADIEQVTAALRDGGYDMTRFLVSVGLWGDRSTGKARRITTTALDSAVRSAATNGITNVNVTPYSLMTAGDWDVLRSAWADTTTSTGAASPVDPDQR